MTYSGTGDLEGLVGGAIGCFTTYTRVGRNRIFSQNFSLQPAKTAKTQFFSSDYGVFSALADSCIIKEESCPQQVIRHHRTADSVTLYG